MHTIRMTLLALMIGTIHSADAHDFFELANTFFGKYVDDKGLVDYASIKANRGQMDQLLSEIAAYDLEKANKATKKAFMINAYNILAINGIIKKYPVKSPMSINNFFDAKAYTVAGKKISLNQLEKEWLYPMAKDPRLHFVLVCAAQSCPKLANYAYVPDNLEKQIEDKTISTINDKNFIKRAGGKLQLSEIFRWYSDDFTRNGSVLDYLNRYFTEKADPKSKISYYSYNWDLNDQK